eukprot:TRINITY_DN6252_c0_g1_i3.p1 TRINITY_DN6252_c0_g1~~TRINITY_DN6252_c0_g1_i3.p1  ORF type:complete len:105 (-),score=15.87 TRINITY_DN6252_c0_g1_i3:12-326(-)
MCFLRNMRGEDCEANPFLAGACSGLWVACEPPARRLELTRIAFKDALYICYHWALEKNLVPVVPHGDTILFCLSTSLLFYLYQNRRDSLQGIVKSMLEFALGGM